MNDAVHIENLSVYYGQTPAIAGVCLEYPTEYLGSRAKRWRKIHPPKGHFGACSHHIRNYKYLWRQCA